MDSEASRFESSETVASFLASTPLLSESWRLCSLANAAAAPPCGFVSSQIGDVGYFAFSGGAIHNVNNQEMQVQEYHWGCRDLVALSPPLFSPLTKNYNSHTKPNDGDRIIHGSDEEEAVMVHAGMLNLFLSLHSTQALQDQMLALIEKSRSIIITGYSIGGTTASLCALWLLSYLQSISSTLSVLCITFGSPLLGNEFLSNAILRERWGGNFCHVVSKYDIVPRLFFAPLESGITQLHFLRQYWHGFGTLGVQLRGKEKAELFQLISACLQDSVQAGQETANSLYWPFGSYLFCSEEGAICLDNAVSVIKMMHLTFVAGNPNCCIEDHLKYEDYIAKISSQFLNKRNFMQEELPETSYEAGVALALQSSGISGQEPTAMPAKECLEMARRLGRTPSLKAANLAIRLSKINPYRAEIEWYKAYCENSNEQLGYYDSFKQASSKRNHKVNMNRHKLAAFWNDLIEMLENNELPHDFHKRAKWVNASQFYQTLVEPLDIADYYRSGMHHEKGHYLKHGRERRFEIFDRWWREKRANEEESSRKRSKYAGLTQDSCFWAKVEEAKDWLANVRNESDVGKLLLLWENISNFESYADRLIKSKEISVDVVAKNSSYMKWVEELRELRSQAHHTHRQLSFLDGN